MSNHKLDFVAIGPFKTATSWMHAYLSEHPEVSLPITVKETYFFSRQDRYKKGLDWFFSNFNLPNESQLLGEFAPAYFTSDVAKERIRKLNPDCTIIISLREPISQLISFYLHKLNADELEQHTTFKQALEQKADLIDNASYYTHITKWCEIYGRENIKIIFYDLLEENPQKFADSLCQAIGVESLTIPDWLDKKVGDNKKPINLQLTKTLKAGSRWLRYIDLYWVINFAKKLGMKKIMYKNNSNNQALYKPSNEEFKFAFNLLAEDLKKLESDWDLDLAKWKQSWRKYGIDNVVSEQNLIKKTG